uniref:Uncharacterized protein n=1 Tax=Globodera pallida TaxID=36090 RepID=A0A183CG42_GLOPA
MTPWWSSNPSLLNNSMESIVEDGRHRQVRPAHAEIGGVAEHGDEPCSSTDSTQFALPQQPEGLFHNAQLRQNQTETYEEIKRLLIFAGLFFMLMTAFVLIKFQVAIDDVFRWSPVVWLIGVIICALLMNVSVQIRRFVQRQKANRLRERQNLLYSLNLPNSFPNLSHHSQLHHQICWHHRHRSYSANEPPGYEQIHRCPLASPPAFVVCVQRQQPHKEAPPKYKADNAQSQSSLGQNKN